MIATAVLALAFAPAVLGECPNIGQVPILYDDNTFTCAQAWQGPGDQDAIRVRIVPIMLYHQTRIQCDHSPFVGLQ